MNIRSATAEDYEAVMQLYNGLVGEDRYSKRDRDSYAEVLALPEHGVFVAENNGKVIGVASVSLRRVIRYKQPIAELDELFVDATSRTHGVGRALLEAVETFARQHNCYRLYIESGYQHKEGHQFYEHLGYKNNGYHFLKNL